MSLCWVHPWCLFCLVQSRYPLLGPPLVFMLSVQLRYPHRMQCAVLVFIRVRWIFSSSDTAEISLNMGRKTLKPLKQGQSHNIATRTKRVIWYHSFYNLQLQGHDHWRNWRIVLAVSVKVWFWMKLLFLYSLTSTYCLILWCLQRHVLALIVVWCFITTIIFLVSINFKQWSKLLLKGRPGAVVRAVSLSHQVTGSKQPLRRFCGGETCLGFSLPQTPLM